MAKQGVVPGEKFHEAVSLRQGTLKAVAIVDGDETDAWLSIELTPGAATAGISVIHASAEELESLRDLLAGVAKAVRENEQLAAAESARAAGSA